MRLKLSFTVMLVIAVSILPIVRSLAQGTGEAVTIVSHVDIIPDAYLAGAEESARRLFRLESDASQKDAGCVSYTVLQETSAPNHFTVVEIWRDAHAYQVHVGSAHMVKFRDGIQPFLGSPFDSRMHRQLR